MKQSEVKILCNNNLIKWFLESYSRVNCKIAIKPRQLLDAIPASDLLILGDYNIAEFNEDPKVLSDIVDQICNGKPLIYYGGWNSYGHGGYKNTRFEEILPINIKQKDLDYFPHNTKGITFSERSRFHKYLIQPNYFPISTSFHRFLNIKNFGEVIAFRSEKGKPNIPLIVSTKKVNQKILCLSFCIVGGGAKDFYIWDQFPFFLKLCVETVLNKDIPSQDSSNTGNPFYVFYHDFFSKKTTYEKIDVIKKNLEFIWFEDNKIDQYTFLGDIAGFFRSEYAAISRMLILPDLFFSNPLEFLYKSVDMYKYQARQACIEYDYSYAATLYMMAFYTQKRIQETIKDQDPNTWSLYFQGMSNICNAFALMAKEKKNIGGIYSSLQRGIELLDLYKNNHELENDVHKDKLLINDLAKALLVIINFIKTQKKYSRLFLFLPTSIKQLLSEKQIVSAKYIDAEIYALSNFTEKYNEIPSIVNKPFSEYIEGLLRIISNYSKQNLLYYKEVYRKYLGYSKQEEQNNWMNNIVNYFHISIVGSYKDDTLILRLNKLSTIAEWIFLIITATIFLLRKIQIPFIKGLLKSINDFLDYFIEFLFVIIFIIELFFKGIIKNFIKGKKL